MNAPLPHCHIAQCALGSQIVNLGLTIWAIPRSSAAQAKNQALKAQSMKFFRNGERSPRRHAKDS